MRIFDLDAERAQTQQPRGLRPVQAFPFGNSGLPFGNSFGPTIAPAVHELQVLGLPAAWRCVNLVANGVAMMAPLEAVAGDGITALDTPPVLGRPDASLTNFEFWHQAVACALVRGNYLGVKADFDTDGYARQIVTAPPGLAQAFYDADGYARYYIAGREYPLSMLVHVRAYKLPGSPWGISSVENFRRAYGMHLEQQHLAADTYHRGSIPTGVITTDKPRQTSEQAQQVQEDWITSLGNAQRKPAVLPQDWKFQPLTWSPEDAQFLQSRTFSVAEMALMMGLDPADVGAAFDGGPSITYANIEQRQISRVIDTYGPWMMRFEQAWSDLMPADNNARFCPDNALRLDSKTRAEVHAMNIDSGVETLTEARNADGKPALTAAQKKERQEAPPAAVMPNAAALLDAKTADSEAPIPPADQTSTGAQA